MSSQGRQVQTSQNASVKGSDPRYSGRGGRGGQAPSGGSSNRGGNPKYNGSSRGGSNRGTRGGPGGRGRGTGRGGSKPRPPRDDNRREEDEEEETVEDGAEEVGEETDDEPQQQEAPAKATAAAPAKQPAAAPPKGMWAAIASKPAPAPAPAPVKVAPAPAKEAPKEAAKEPVKDAKDAAPKETPKEAPKEAAKEPAKEPAKSAAAASTAGKPAAAQAAPAPAPAKAADPAKPAAAKEAAAAPAPAAAAAPATLSAASPAIVPPARTASAPPVMDETLARNANPQIPSKSYGHMPYVTNPNANPYYPQTYATPHMAQAYGYGPQGVFMPGSYTAGAQIPPVQYQQPDGVYIGGTWHPASNYMGYPQQTPSSPPQVIPKKTTRTPLKIVDPATGQPLDLTSETASSPAKSTPQAPPGAPQELIMAETKRKEAEAKKKAEEEEARKKAEEEAKKKAEEEAAKKKAEEEAKKKAEEEAARKKAEEEAKKKAEEEARKKAEEEAAKKKAEEEAKKKAEEEAAKKKADEERKQAQEDSRESGDSADSGDEDAWDKRNEDEIVSEVSARKINYDLNPQAGWRPDNPEGVRIYSRDFLLQMQEDPLVASIQVPIDPEVSRVISEGLTTGRGGASRGGYRSGGSTPRGDSPRNYDKGGRGGRGGRGGKSGGGKRGGGVPPGSPKDNRPFMPVPERTENAWVRPKGNDKDIERKMRGLLNKLTPEKFERLLGKLLDPKEIPIGAFEDIAALIDLIFENALLQTKFSSMYAELCSRLAEKLPQFPVVTKDETSGEEKKEVIPFKRLLLNKCQYEFENRKKPPVIPTELPETSEQRQELELEALKIRQRNLGLMKFIGELYKKRMLIEKVMHHCLMGLLAVEDNEEDLKHFCEFISTIGGDLDNDKGNNKQLFNYYISKCNEIIAAEKVSPRIRFLLLDVVDLRKKNWESKKAQEGPKTLQEVHEDLAKAEREKEIALREQERSSAALRRSGRDEFRRDMVPASPSRGRGGAHNAPESPAAGGGWSRVGGGGKEVRGGRGGPVRGARGGGIARGGSSSSLASSGSIPATKEGAAKNMFASLMGNDEEEEENVREEEEEEDVAPEEEEDKPAESTHERTEVLAAAEQYKKGELDEDGFQSVLEEHILDEMFESGEIVEAVESVRQLHATTYSPNLVQLSVWHALEQNRPAAREAVCKFLEKVATAVPFFTNEHLVEGINLLFELAADMTVDIAKNADIWFGEILGYCVGCGILSAQTLVSEIWSGHRKSKDTRRVFGATIAWLNEHKGADVARDFITQSSLKLEEFVSDSAALIQEMKIAQLFGPVISVESLVAEGKPVADIVAWVKENVQQKDPKFASRVAAAVFGTIKAADAVDAALTSFKPLFEVVLNGSADDANAQPFLAQVEAATHQRLGGAETLAHVFDWLYTNGLVRIKQFKLYIDDEDPPASKTAQLFKVSSWFDKAFEAAKAKKAGK
eukprot:TRINITY_DN46_c0_g1_i1.p1 TRINITY_DN46_c0_g1~~TRINITY_DN46_c0_g1_i1.p1  ORF type:complete len:1464 (+),score=574.31 TRINITY_DN46_c0_g1_i1:234-4625(+)